MSDLYEEISKRNKAKLNPDSSNVIPIGNLEFGLEIEMADKINPLQQPWFWPGIVPLHTTTLFAGMGGIGKSQLLLFIAGASSTGRKFAAGGIDHQVKKGKVIILSGEDDKNYQLIPKLMALNADLSKIAILKTMCAPGKNPKFIDLDAHLNLLEEAIKKLEDVKLIIIDPIHYFTGAMRDHISTEVSNFIGRLNDLAKKYDLAIILNKHLRKKNTGESIATAVDEVAGSGAWVNSVRQSWIMYPHPKQEDKVLFMNLKVNIAKKNNQAMAYKIEKAIIIDKKGKSIDTTSMTWFNMLEDITVEQAASKENYEKSKLQSAIEYIYNHLKNNGQSLLSTIKDNAMRDGIAEYTFRRAYAEFEQSHKQNLHISKGVRGAKMYMLIEE